MGLLFILISVLDTYNTERPDTEEPVELTKRDHLDLNKRLGYAILLKAGYGKVALVERNNEETAASKLKPEVDLKIKYTFVKSHPDLKCINTETPVEKLTIAILAAEKYNRTAFERSIESWIAKIIFKYFGKVPDFSLGLAQIRPSTIRKMVEENLGQTNISDSGILSMALDDCLNPKLAQQYITYLFNHQNLTDNIDERIERVARSYNGSINKNVHGMRYEDAVLGAYNILCGEYYECEESEGNEGNEGNTPSITGCIKFDMATVLPLAGIEWNMIQYKLEKNTDGKDEKFKDIGDKKTENAQEENAENLNDLFAEEELKRLVNEIKLIRVQLYERESKPTEFVTQLSDKRNQWIIKYFVDLGFPKTNISIEKASFSEMCVKDAEDNEDLSGAKITVILNKKESISSLVKDVNPSVTITPVVNESTPNKKEPLKNVTQAIQKNGDVNNLESKIDELKSDIAKAQHTADDAIAAANRAAQYSQDTNGKLDAMFKMSMTKDQESSSRPKKSR
jgi:murein lipoprotein